MAEGQEKPRQINLEWLAELKRLAAEFYATAACVGKG